MLTGVLKDRRGGDEEEAPGKGSSRYEWQREGGTVHPSNCTRSREAVVRR